MDSIKRFFFHNSNSESNPWYEDISNRMRAFMDSHTNPMEIHPPQLQFLDEIIDDILSKRTENEKHFEIANVFSRICELCSFTSENSENAEFWIGILEKLLDPVKRVYLSSSHRISDEDLPRYYLFVGSIVLYKDRECVVCGINPKGIELILNAEGSKVKQVGLMDKHLSIPDYIFQRNFMSWIDSLSIGEVVDVSVKENGVVKWKRGVIVSREQSTNLQALIVKVNNTANSFQAYDDSRNSYITIREFTSSFINRAFLKSYGDSTPLVEPLRYNYTHNLLFFQPNIVEDCEKGGCTVYDCEDLISPLFVRVLNLVTMHNIWYNLTVSFDSNDMNLDTYVRVLYLFSKVCYLFDRVGMAKLESTVLSPLTLWYLTLPENTSPLSCDTIAKVIQLYSEVYEIMPSIINDEIRNPCLFFIVVVRSLIISKSTSRIQIVLSLLQRLFRESVSLMAWKSHRKLLVIPDFDFKLLAQTLIDTNLLYTVMNHDELKIRESAAIVLCFDCYSDSYKDIIEFYIECMTEQLQAGDRATFESLWRSLTILSCSSLLCIVEILMSNSFKKSIPYELYTSLAKELKLSNSLSPDMSIFFLDYFSHLTILKDTSFQESELSDACRACLDVLAPTFYHTRIAQIVDAIKSMSVSTSQLMEMVILIQKSIDFSSTINYTDTFDSILKMLISELKEKHFVLCSALLTVDILLISFVNVHMTDSYIMDLWEFTRQDLDNRFISKLIDFLQEVMTIVDPLVYEQMVEVAIKEGRLEEANVNYWNFVFRLWKAVNDVHHHFESIPPIESMDGYKFVDELKYPSFIITSATSSSMHHAVTAQNFLENLIMFSNLSLVQRITVVQLLIHTSLDMIGTDGNDSKYERFINFLINLLKSQVYHNSVLDNSLNIKLRCEITITPSSTETVTVSINPMSPMSSLSQLIREKIKQNCILQYCNELSRYEMIDTKIVRQCNLYDGNTVFVRVLHNCNRKDQNGVSYPIENDSLVDETLSEITMMLMEFFFPKQSSLSLFSRRNSFDDLASILFPIKELDNLVNLTLENTAPCYFGSNITTRLGCFLYFFYHLRATVMDRLYHNPSSIRFIINALSTQNIPLFLLTALLQFPMEVVMWESVIGFLFECYRPLILFTSCYSTLLTYLSYHSPYDYSQSHNTVFPSDALPMRTNIALEAEADAISVFFDCVSELRSTLYSSKDALLWMWQMPELSQPIAEFWENAFIRTCSSDFPPRSIPFAYYLLYYSLRLIFIGFIQQCPKHPQIRQTVSSLVEAVENCSWMTQAISEELRLWFNYSFQFVRIHSSAAYKPAFRGLLHNTLDKKHWKKDDSFGVQLLSEIMSWYTVQVNDATVVVHFVAVMYLQLPDEEKHCFLNFISKLNFLKFVCTIGIISPEYTKLITAMYQFYANELTTLRLLPHDNIFDLLTTWSNNIPLTINEAEPLYKYAMEKVPFMKCAVLPCMSKSNNRGMQNEGCTCYVNSLMQVLYHIRPFRIFVQAMSVKSGSTADERSGFALRNLFKSLSEDSLSAVSMSQWIRSYVKPNGQHIDPYVQEDAHEYLNEFFERFESVCSFFKIDSIVPKLFESKMHVTLKCPNCGVISSTSEVFNCVSVDVKGYHSLHDSLYHIFEDEDIESYSCESCKKSVTIQKQASYSSSAKYLFFHLKRFEYNSIDNVRVKIGDEFTFDQVLILPVEGKTILYRLKAIVTHNGDAEGGHYISYIRERGKWMEFNDSIVRVCTDVNSMFQHCFGADHMQCAYMLLYECDDDYEVDVKSILPMLFSSYGFWKLTSNLTYLLNNEKNENRKLVRSSLTEMITKFYVLSCVHLLPAITQKISKCGLHYKDNPIFVDAEDQAYYQKLYSILVRCNGCYKWACEVIHEFIRSMDNIIQEHYSLEIERQYFNMISSAVSVCIETLNESFSRECLTALLTLISKVFKKLKEYDSFVSVMLLRILKFFGDSDLLKRIIFLTPFIDELNPLMNSLLSKVSFCSSSYFDSFPDMKPSDLLVSVVYSFYTGCDVADSVLAMEANTYSILPLSTDKSDLSILSPPGRHQYVPCNEIYKYINLLHAIASNEEFEDAEAVWKALISYEPQYVLSKREMVWISNPEIITAFMEITHVEEVYKVFRIYTSDDDCSQSLSQYIQNMFLTPDKLTTRQVRIIMDILVLAQEDDVLFTYFGNLLGENNFLCSIWSVKDIKHRLDLMLIVVFSLRNVALRSAVWYRHVKTKGLAIAEELKDYLDDESRIFFAYILYSGRSS